MLFSPAKRRKIDNNPDTDASHANGNADDRPRPRNEANSMMSDFEAQSRAAGRSPIRSPTRTADQDGQYEQREQQGARGQNDGRMFGLRDRKALRPSLTSAASPSSELRGSPLLSPPKRSSGIQAFAAPPRRVSRKILPTDLAFGSPVGQGNPSQRAHRDNTQNNQLGPELSGAEDNYEVRGLDQHLQEEFNEPELPPTPTQLGLEKHPDGQSGLLSSSPSKHGRRIRRRTTDYFQPSLLALEDDGTDRVGEVEDAPKREFEESVSEAVLKKLRSRTELSTELQQLKNEVKELENWNQKLDQIDDPKEPVDMEALDKLILSTTSEETSDTAPAARSAIPSISSLISSMLPFSSKRPPKSTRPISASPTNPFALRESAQARPYLTIFAPLALTTQSTKASASLRSNALGERHKLTLSAPPPFPRNLYNVTVIYETNLEIQSLVSISVPTINEPQESNIPETLRHWLNSRLENPLLKLDISGLCWGINRYWEAATYRAQLWLKVERKYSGLAASRTRARSIDPGSSTTGDDQNNSDVERSSETFTTSSLRFLIPHLERSSMLFTSNESQKPHRPKILLSCPIALDEWTGEPQLCPEISVSAPLGVDGVSTKRIERETKKLFSALLSEGSSSKADANGVTGIGDASDDTIVRAIGGVLEVLFATDIGRLIPKNKKALGSN